MLSRNDGRHVPSRLAILAIVLTLPALAVGFAQDDYFLLGVFKGYPGLEGLQQEVWNGFTFSEGDPVRNRLRMERGIMPWWSVGNWKMDFWRPVASMTHWVDYKIFGETAWPMHVHSLLLYGLLVFFVARLYRRFETPVWIAGLAGLMFAVDSAHGIPAGWISNRNALLSALFGVLAMLNHDTWRRGKDGRGSPGPWYPHGLWALVWLGLALFSAEAAVALGGYFFAYALFIDPRTQGLQPLSEPRSFLSSLKALVPTFGLLLPYLGVVILWRLVYTGNGHGVSGSFMYVDPLNDFEVFLNLLVDHFPILMLGLFGAPDSTIWALLPHGWQLLNLGLAIVFLSLVAWGIWPMLRKSNIACFWFVASIIAVLPACATLPTDRNLMYPSIGAMALMAMYVGGVVDGQHWTRGSRLRISGGKALANLLIIIHIVGSAVMLTVSSFVIAFMDRGFQYANTGVPMDGVEVGDRIIAINTPLDLLGASLPLLRASTEEPVPTSWWWLSAGSRPVDVERIDTRTIVLRPEAGFLNRPWSQIFRRPSADPMAAGDRIQLSEMTVEVLSVTEDGRPKEAKFTFTKRLEHPSLHWVTWSGGTYVPFPLPPPGETRRVPGLDPLYIVRLTLGLEDDGAPALEYARTPGD